MDGQIAEEGQMQGSSTQLALLALFVLEATSEKETDGQMEEKERWRICQEQSLKTVCDQMNTYCSFSLSSLYLSFSLFPLHSIIALLCYRGGCVAASEKAADVTQLLPTENRLRRKERREWAAGEFGSPSFFISNHERADGDAEHLWL